MNLNERIADGYRLLSENYIAQVKGEKLAPVSAKGRRNMILAIAYETGCLAVTQLMEKHPEGWDGPCECQNCLEAAQ